MNTPKRPPLEVGDRVRVYEAELAPYSAEVLEIGNIAGCDYVRIEANGKIYRVHPRQCVRLRKRPKPEKEPVVRWLAGDCEWQCSPTREAAERHRDQFSEKFGGIPIRRLQEVPEGSVVVSRESLAKAWDTSHLVAESAKSQAFQTICEALGLPEKEQK